MLGEGGGEGGGAPEGRVNFQWCHTSPCSAYNAGFVSGSHAPHLLLHYTYVNVCIHIYKYGYMYACMCLCMCVCFMFEYVCVFALLHHKYVIMQTHTHICDIFVIS